MTFVELQFSIHSGGMSDLHQLPLSDQDDEVVFLGCTPITEKDGKVRTNRSKDVQDPKLRPISSGSKSFFYILMV